jgi:hypothetical protein
VSIDTNLLEHLDADAERDVVDPHVTAAAVTQVSGFYRTCPSPDAIRTKERF